MLSLPLSNKKRDFFMKTVSNRSKGLFGTFATPGDKSLSHRALMLGGLAKGSTKIKGLLESDDVMATLSAMRKLGADIEKHIDGAWTVAGVDSALRAPDSVLDMGNAGTGTRLLAGLVCTHPFETRFTGDASLCSRPMNRITLPLAQTGARFETAQGGTLPMTVIGAKAPKPIAYRLPVASAQVKSAVLLAGLNINGDTTVIEPADLKSRDHTERMLRGFGAALDIAEDSDGARILTVHGKTSLTACDLTVPADISSAAFPIVAALITPDSELFLPDIGINPLRSGILTALKAMGADITLENSRIAAGEPVADIRVKSSELHGVDLPASLAPSMIDEYPILAIAAAFADGKTTLRGVSELKVKESNRFDAILNGLNANGVACSALGNDIEIKATGKKPCGGGLIEAKLDHRIAMSFLVMGMAAENPVAVDDISSIATSFPNFIELMNKSGANIHDYRD